MSDYAAPILYAVVIWWFLTGAILWLNHRPRRTHAWSFGATTVALFGALWVIAWSASQESEAGAYAAFTAALIVWGWQEMAFYMGYVAGPRRTPGVPPTGASPGSARPRRPTSGTRRRSSSALPPSPG